MIGEEYENYWNDNAHLVFTWSLREYWGGNRIKASKLKKIADKMEYRWRRYYNLPDGIPNKAPKSYIAAMELIMKEDSKGKEIIDRLLKKSS